MCVWIYISAWGSNYPRDLQNVCLSAATSAFHKCIILIDVCVKYLKMFFHMCLYRFASTFASLLLPIKFMRFDLSFIDLIRLVRFYFTQSMNSPLFILSIVKSHFESMLYSFCRTTKFDIALLTECDKFLNENSIYKMKYWLIYV